jgi:osmotically-inducible protein OsmY
MVPGIPHRRGAVAWAAALLWLAILPGCTALSAYEKCGFQGCEDDRRIATEVRALFDQHPVLMPPNLISVRAIDRVVYLGGIVDTDMERQIAESVASQANDVARVVNSIGLNNSR